MQKNLGAILPSLYERPLQKTGRFSPDDAKVGEILAFTFSTARASYFPKAVTTEQSTYKIEPLALPYPYIESKDRYAVQQGVRMSITENDEARDYGTAVFLNGSRKQRKT